MMYFYFFNNNKNDIDNCVFYDKCEQLFILFFIKIGYFVVNIFTTYMINFKNSVNILFLNI